MTSDPEEVPPHQSPPPTDEMADAASQDDSKELHTTPSPVVNPTPTSHGVSSHTKPAVKPRQTVLSFISLPDELYNKQVAKDYEIMRERAREIQEREERLNRQKEEKRKKNNRERKRKQRELEKEKEIRQGERSPGGTKKPKLKNAVARLSDPGPSSSGSISVAEASRPRRAFNDRDIIHRNPDAKLQAPKRTNIFNPLIWIQIEEAASHTKPRMSPREIHQILVRRNPTVFKTIAEQTIGRLIDRTGDQPVWSKATLDKVEKERVLQRKETTRHGILVSCLTLSNDR